jgi:hypothetical protein
VGVLEVGREQWSCVAGSKVCGCADAVRGSRRQRPMERRGPMDRAGWRQRTRSGHPDAGVRGQRGTEGDRELHAKGWRWRLRCLVGASHAVFRKRRRAHLHFGLVHSFIVKFTVNFYKSTPKTPDRHTYVCGYYWLGDPWTPLSHTHVSRRRAEKQP